MGQEPLVQRFGGADVGEGDGGLRAHRVCRRPEVVVRVVEAAGEFGLEDSARVFLPASVAVHHCQRGTESRDAGRVCRSLGEEVTDLV